MEVCETHGRLRCAECAYVLELEEEIKNLKMDKEDMYQLATRAEFNEGDWKEFERIFNKN